jgi:hypothetical protein
MGAVLPESQRDPVAIGEKDGKLYLIAAWE